MRRFLRSTLIAALNAGIVATLSAQGATPRTLRGLERVDSLVAAEFAKDSTGSLTVGVISGSELVWTRSLGFADIKSRRPATRQTVYRIGSITKPFTAVMLMQLVHAGKVRLSDPVERYLPEISQLAGKPAGAAPITFLQLATMTAGLAREPEQRGPFWSGPVASWERTMLSALPHTRYQSIPGTEYAYSNIGYAILGAALSRAAATPFVEWQRSRIFTPLGMTRTRFEIDPTIAADVATGYQVGPDGTLDDTTATREGRTGRGYKVPNGAIYTTVDDLARFVSFELSRGPETVLPRASLDAAFEGLVASDRSLAFGYGLGFAAMTRDGYAYLGHNGGVAGFLASMYYDRYAKLGVVVFENVAGGKRDGDRLAVDILSMLANRLRTEVERDIAARVKAQTPSPGTEAAIRRLVDELRAGTPNFDLMSVGLASEVRRQQAEHAAALTRLGAVRTVTFRSVAASGANVYHAVFERGTLEWRVWMNLDGTVDVFRFREVATAR